MDTSIKFLINSISRFIHLASCQTVILMPLQQDYKRVAGVLKLVKALLDEVTDYEYSEKILYKHCEELDMAVNEAREFMEKWSPKMSKICFAIWSEPLLKKIQSSALKICSILQSSSTLAGVKPCMQEIESLKRETIIEFIEEAMGSQENNVFLGTKHLMRIAELLGLTSSQELLKESIAVEKERISAELNGVKRELNQIDQVVVLVSDIRHFMVKSERREATTGVPIPSYFRCPLSTELMLDPVIVASGQTYERSSIQKWLDHGLTVCPKTRQLLTHKNMIPNYTVKAMIATWCEENNVKIPLISDHSNIVSVPSLSNRNNSTSRASLETGNRFEKQHGDVSPRISGEKSNGCHRSKSGNRSPEELFIHSRSVSTSSAVSSIDYVLPAFKELSTISIKPETRNDCFGEITTESVGICPPSKESRIYPWLSGKELHISETKADMAGSGIIKFNSDSYSSPNSVSEDLITASLVTNLIEDLRSQSIELQTKAAEELRLLAKHNTQNRIIISQCGAIKPLLSLLYSDMKLTQEHAVTALLNLSINEKSKVMIAETGAIDPLIHVLKTGNDAAKENSAAALFSLSVLQEYRAKIGRSSAVKALVDLLRSGTLRGKKDAATALFNLSIFHENKARIVQAGAIKYLIELMHPDSGMVDKSVALLANLSTIGEGCMAIVREEGIPLLIEIAESGSHRSKENAASILLQLCLHSPKICTMVLQEGAVPPLVALSQSGTPRAKEKAQQLLSHFRNHREGATGKGKS